MTQSKIRLSRDAYYDVSISYNHTTLCMDPIRVCDFGLGLPDAPNSYIHGKLRYGMCVCGYQNSWNWVQANNMTRYHAMLRNAVNSCVEVTVDVRS